MMMIMILMRNCGKEVKRMVHFDWWDGKAVNLSLCTATVTFYPNEGIYRGNVYKDGEPVGDFWSKDSVAIEKCFPHIFG